MSKLQEALSQAAKETSGLPVNTCRTCYVLEGLNTEDKAAFQAALDNKSIINKVLRETVKNSLGFDLGTSIDRHRKKACKGTSE